MGAACGNKRSGAGSMTWLALALVFALCSFTSKSEVLVSERELSNHGHARRKLDDISGNINIDCGMLEVSYTDEKTELHYHSDADNIDTGENKNISSALNAEKFQRSLRNVRSFPQGSKNCYTLAPPEGKDTTYFIRATFMYGNYDSLDQLPAFDLYVGVNQWDTVKFDNTTHIVIKEIIHVTPTDDINVCLVNTGSGTPFISALELRHFLTSSYRIENGSSLLLYRRFDVGSTTGEVIRFKEDSFDRMWFPYNVPQSEPFNTSEAIDALEQTDLNLPSIVMETAVKPLNANGSLDFDFDAGDPTLKFYAYLHFAELENLELGNEHREFYIDLNGNQLGGSVVPRYLHSTTVSTPSPVRGPKLSFSIYKTQNSTLPPILNAVEVYIEKDFLQEPTYQEDSSAMVDVRQSYGVNKIWQGDPCLPKPWDGLNCSDKGYDPPRIISLNLSSSGLTGTISPSLGNLKSLQYLDLSNNSLTGTVPEFLSELPVLKALNLNGNKLSGTIPSALMARKTDGSLLLSVDANPDLCVMAPCKKKKKNFVVPLVAAVVSLLVAVLVLFVIWSYHRKRAAERVGKTQSQGFGPLKTENQHFTYAEVVSLTNNFQTIIGKGGFGTVYHGCLSDGTQVAVKMLSTSSTQGSEEFLAEVQLLMRVHHRNLATFIAYCFEGPHIGIIYEYMAGGNLAEYLSDKTKDALSWKERLKISVDAAQGLEYLHHGCKPPIIHRDVKTANILLNEKMQAKLADFGLSKCLPIESQSHLLTDVVGTMGYLDPEYFACNRLTERSDVYSFGIVLLEIITGQPALQKRAGPVHIVQWVSPLLEKGDIKSIVDPRVQGNFDTNSVWKAVETAMACVPLNSNQRPTMSEVMMELKDCLEMQTAYEQNSAMWDQSSLKFQMSPTGLETEVLPLAR